MRFVKLDELLTLPIGTLYAQVLEGEYLFHFEQLVQVDAPFGWMALMLSPDCFEIADNQDTDSALADAIKTDQNLTFNGDRYISHDIPRTEERIDEDPRDVVYVIYSKEDIAKLLSVFYKAFSVTA